MICSFGVPRIVALNVRVPLLFASKGFRKPKNIGKNFQSYLGQYSQTSGWETLVYNQPSQISPSF